MPGLFFTRVLKNGLQCAYLFENQGQRTRNIQVETKRDESSVVKKIPLLRIYQNTKLVPRSH